MLTILPPPEFPHVREDRANAQERAAHVDGERLVPAVHVDVHEPGDAVRSEVLEERGVVHEAVDAPEPLEREAGHLERLRLIAHVHAQGQYLAALRADDFGRLLAVAHIADDHLRAFLGEAARVNLADIPGPACQDDDLVLNPSHCRPPYACFCRFLEPKQLLLWRRRRPATPA